VEKFVITGFPRSATTVFTKTIAQLDNVEIFTKSLGTLEPYEYNDKEMYVSPEADLQYYESLCNKKYFGFKSFNTDVMNNDYLFQQGYRPISLIRKDVWKSVTSWCALHLQSNNDQVAKFFEESTKNHVFDKENFESLRDIPKPVWRLFSKALYSRIRVAYQVEKYYNNIDVIYFEDLIKPNSSFEKLNNYFDQEIVFNLNYEDDMEARDYTPSLPKEFYQHLCRQAKMSLVLPDDTPDYILESINRYL
jgi:hypothetical protein